MAFSAITGRSARKAAPLVHQSFQYSATVFSAVNRASLYTQLNRAVACSTTRYFSSSVATQSPPASQTIIEILQNEIDLALESEEHDKTIQAPKGLPFSIDDNAGEQIVTLTREYEGETITVEVSMPNLVTGEYDDDDEEEDVDDEDEKETSLPSSVPLLVTITKKDAPSLKFCCTACPDEITINSLSVKNPEAEAEDEFAYEGPDFNDLNENLQKAFHKYLEIRGIKPATTNFLHEYMIDKDSKEYIKWLKDVKQFVEA